MSFDIFVTAFRDKDVLPIPTSDVIRRFSAHIKDVEKDYGWWRLHFEEGPCLARLSVDEGETTNGFGVLRPPGYLTFWEIIAGVLKDLPCVLYWPGDRAVMGSLELLPHLPDDLIEAFGIPLVCTDGAKIRQYVEENS
ncbi:MAG: hypothetical protein IT563_22710 [Alphaproteobacteria bacterium]|nr:hypothetical protein [Alphaproteobacteria bacterium]